MWLSAGFALHGIACADDHAPGGHVASDGSAARADAGTSRDAQLQFEDPLGPEPSAGPAVVEQGMAFIPISAGTFTMGSPPDEPGRHADEGPQHRVTLSAFEIGQTEVTHEQYARYLRENPAAPQPLAWRPDSPGDEPVTGVNIVEALHFAQWMNGRLPTEAEWECAARAGTSGAAYGEPDAIAWYWDNAGRKPHAVGTKQPNAWGLHDMFGNVYEWVSDWYALYDAQPVVDPQGPANGRLRIVRGGAFENEAGALRAADRLGYAGDERRPRVGFRVARAASGPR